MKREMTVVVAVVSLVVGCGAGESVGAPETAPLAATTEASSTSVSTSTTSRVIGVTTTAATPTSETSVAEATPSTSSTTLVTSTTRPAPSTTEAAGPRVVSFTIPLGTAARIDAGENVDDVLPPSLKLNVGDRLVLINQDDTFHIYGPLGARSGETIRYEFSVPGTYQGFCTANSERLVVIEVS